MGNVQRVQELRRSNAAGSFDARPNRLRTRATTVADAIGEYDDGMDGEMDSNDDRTCGRVDCPYVGSTDEYGCDRCSSCVCCCCYAHDVRACVNSPVYDPAMWGA